MITLKAVLVTAPAQQRAELEPLSDFKLVAACAALDLGGEISDPAIAMCHTLRALAQRWLDLHEEIKIHSAHLKSLTTEAAPQLVAAFGIGLDIG